MEHKFMKVQALKKEKKAFAFKTSKSISFGQRSVNLSYKKIPTLKIEEPFMQVKDSERSKTQRKNELQD